MSRSHLRLRTQMLGVSFVSALCAVCGFGLASANEYSITPGSYAIESQMVMPHLDEMRQIYKHSTACVDSNDAAILFPVFAQPAMTACTLLPSDVSPSRTEYVLDCAGVNGASGSAYLNFTDHAVNGSLKAKMGGKNMTFSQYIKASRRGDCAK